MDTASLLYCSDDERLCWWRPDGGDVQISENARDVLLVYRAAIERTADCEMPMTGSAFLEMLIDIGSDFRINLYWKMACTDQNVIYSKRADTNDTKSEPNDTKDETVLHTLKETPKMLQKDIGKKLSFSLATVKQLMRNILYWSRYDGLSRPCGRGAEWSLFLCRSNNFNQPLRRAHLRRQPGGYIPAAGAALGRDEIHHPGEGVRVKMCLCGILHKQLAKVKPEKREQFAQRQSRELILYDAAAGI